MTNDELKALLNQKEEPAENTQQVSSIPVKSSFFTISEDAKLASDKAMQYPRVQRELGVVPITRTIRGQVVPDEVSDKYREIERYSKKREVKDYSKTDDWIADPMRAGTIDSVLGKTADVADDIKGGSGYRTDSSAWAEAVDHPIDTFTSKEKTKKIVQDLAYLTGQQLADLPVILGIGAVTGGSLGMAMGGASALHGGLERQRDTGEVDALETAKDFGKGFAGGTILRIGMGLTRFPVGLATKSGLTKAGVSEKVANKIASGVANTTGFLAGNEAMMQAQAMMEGKKIQPGERALNLISNLAVDSVTRMGGNIHQKMKSDEQINAKREADSSKVFRADNDEVVSNIIDRTAEQFLKNHREQGLDDDSAFGDWLNANERVISDRKKAGKANKPYEQRRKAKVADDPAVKERYIKEMAHAFERMTGNESPILEPDGSLNEYGKIYTYDDSTIQKKRNEIMDEVSPEFGTDFGSLLDQHIKLSVLDNVRNKRIVNDVALQKEELGGVSRLGFLNRMEEPTRYYAKEPLVDKHIDMSNVHVTGDARKVLKDAIRATREDIAGMVKRADNGTTVSAIESIFKNIRTASNVIRRLNPESYRFLYEPMREADAMMSQRVDKVEKELQDATKRLTEDELHRASLYAIRVQEKNTAEGRSNVGEKIIQNLIADGSIDPKDVVHFDKLNAKEQGFVNYLFGLNKDYWERSNTSRLLADNETVMGLDDYVQLVFDNKRLLNDRDMVPWLLKQKLGSDYAHRSTFKNKRFGGSGEKIKLNLAEVQMSYARAMERIINMAPVEKKWLEYAEEMEKYNKPVAEYIRETAKFVAGETVDTTPAKRWIHAANENIMVAYLSAGLNTLITQPTAIAGAISEFGYGTVLDAAHKILASKLDFTGEDNLVKNNQVRSAVLKSAIFDVAYRDIKDKSFASTWNKYKTMGLEPMKMLDFITREIVFEAGMSHYKKKGMSPQDAKFYADEAVNRTQGSGSRLDVSIFQRNALGKLLLSFQTFTISNLNYLSSDLTGDDPTFKDVNVFKTEEGARKYAKETGKTYEAVDMGNGDIVYSVYDKSALTKAISGTGKLLRYALFAAIANSAFELMNDKTKFLGIRRPFPSPVDTWYETKYGYSLTDKMFNTKEYQENRVQKPRMKETIVNGRVVRVPETKLQYAGRMAKAQLATNTQPIPYVSGVVGMGEGGGALLGTIGRIGKDLQIASESGKAREYLNVANTASALAGNPFYQIGKYAIRYNREMEKQQKENRKLQGKYDRGAYNSGYNKQYKSKY